MSRSSQSICDSCAQRFQVNDDQGLRRAYDVRIVVRLEIDVSAPDAGGGGSWSFDVCPSCVDTTTIGQLIRKQAARGDAYGDRAPREFAELIKRDAARGPRAIGRSDIDRVAAVAALDRKGEKPDA